MRPVVVIISLELAPTQQIYGGLTVKRTIAALSALLLLLVPLAASHAAEKGDLHYGIKAGPSFSATYAEGGRTEFRITFAGGAFMSYNVSTMFQIQPEILYMGRGWKETAGSLTLTNKLSYIDFSLLLKLAIPSQSKLSSSIGIGPYLGYKISDGYEFNMSLPDVVDEAMDLIYDNLKSTDIGIVVSGELDVAMNNGGMILFDLRLTYGFQKIFDEIEIGDVPIGTIDLKNMGFQILVGYAF